MFLFSIWQRGNDVPHSPVMYAYLIVELNSAKLFVDKSKVNPEVMDYLKKAGIELKPYDSILSEIQRYFLFFSFLFFSFGYIIYEFV